MTINLFVGDCNDGLSVDAKNFDATAYLLDHSNFEQYLNLSDKNVTVYTSAADLPKISKDRAVLYEVLQKADSIYYRPPTVWSDHNPEFSLRNQQQITEYFLYLVNQEKNNVDGLNLISYTNTPYLKLLSRRSSNDSQLWIAGCSVTAGAGVSPDEKYSTIISQKFNNNFLDLSKSGASLEFSADQILRSDIRKNDIVVWGLTSEYRTPYWDRPTQQATHFVLKNYNFLKPSATTDLTDETRLYKAIISVKQVANFCEKIEARLIVVPIICSEALQLLLCNEAFYYQFPYQPRWADIGTDDVHPGPKQHQWYAEHINNIIKGL